MIGPEQEMEIDLRVKSAVEAFLRADDSITIEDVSKLLGVSRNTVQRYLNNLDRIANIYGSTKAENILSLIREKLLRIKKIHSSKKALIKSENNISAESPTGTFSGSEKRVK